MLQLTFFLIASVKKGLSETLYVAHLRCCLFTSSLNCCQSVCQVKLIKIGLLRTSYRYSIWMIIYWEKSVGHFFQSVCKRFLFGRYFCSVGAVLYSSLLRKIWIFIPFTVAEIWDRPNELFSQAFWLDNSLVYNSTSYVDFSHFSYF